MNTTMTMAFFFRIGILELLILAALGIFVLAVIFLVVFLAMKLGQQSK